MSPILPSLEGGSPAACKQCLIPFTSLTKYWPLYTKPLVIFSPQLPSWVGALSDPRMQGKIIYPLPILFWEALLLFLLKLEARRQITFILRPASAPLLSHLAALIKEDHSFLSTIACDDAVNDLLTEISIAELQLLLQKMVARLIRKRVLDHARLLDRWYMIAIDGSGLFCRRKRHCPRCLIKKSQSGELLYYHHVLEAKLITVSGLALSICSEFIENDVPDCLDISKEEYKQDCEIKAFKRLAPRLKAAFPRLPICILGDSLYAAAPIMNICKEFSWTFCISFKEGSIPSIYKEFQSLLPLQPQNRMTWETKSVRQTISWANDIEYRDHAVHLIQCIDHNKNDEQKKFLYLTNISTTTKTVPSLTNGAGRQRWKIENQGFNMQKNGGYNLEHVYSNNENAAQCFYILLQIAHLINQLIEHGNLIENLRKRYGSLKNLSRFLLIAFITSSIDPSVIDALFQKPFQIRLNSS
jgi:hypothetical protein